MSRIRNLLARQSFVELSARERASVLLDGGSGRELAGRFDRMVSPWLVRQEIVPQSDDGVVIMKGTVDGKPVVVSALDGGFQGGSLGEAGGAKMAAALEMAVRDNQNGVRTAAVLLLETGGVRLQEANLGLAAIAEIQAAIVALRQYAPVVAVIAGSVGCFGGMSIAAGLCSHIVMTPEGRLGLNGPQVIEQEAGVEEYDAKDRVLIWGLCGGRQRYDSGLADVCVADDVFQIRQSVAACVQGRVAGKGRYAAGHFYLSCLNGTDTEQQAEPEDVLAAYGRMRT
ncbi:biotin-independent malonate decarboxylase subunit beta [Neisseria leonii]|uniref:Biotin-independent malonate decarboxylase subunit beta n=1 Tax=Neisseria leonii TaxID=2995413 RepID=A0A9X4EB29_9NEIS|nr:biotin-independent malonate decarboxylase subunit beta [Neisseria sp. 51.81]MDD9328703.1 biotin-independent malonate decarboxylase subunit beta [Neisseria sp. 51.81]